MMNGYAALTGTEKQIAWAEDIRSRFFDRHLEAITDEATKAEFLAIINRKTSAKWWIEEVQNKAMIFVEDVMMKLMND